MKVRWLEHEASLIGIISGIFIFRYLWEKLRLSQQQIDVQYAAPFVNAHHSFNYYTRVLFPQIASVWVFIICFAVCSLNLPNIICGLVSLALK